MILCMICRNIPVEPGAIVNYDHHKTCQELIFSAETCQCCSLIFNTFVTLDESTVNLNKESNVMLTISGGERRKGMLLTAALVGTRLKTNFDIRVDYGKIYFQNYCSKPSTDLVEDSPAASSHFLQGRNLLRDSNSGESYAMIESWLNDCFENHKDSCGTKDRDDRLSESYVTLRYPTRLVDLMAFGNNPDVRIVNSTKKMKDYAALSYCWGPHITLRTTKASLSAHRRRIRFAALPQTLQDAITSTRRLGVQYLWIDALCIIQDDEMDWRREASRMGYIYQNAFFTLAATGASDSSQGCFFPRSADQPFVRIPFRKGTDAEAGDEFTLVPSQNDFLVDVVQSPWNSRGWTLQERLLSKRIIHFAKGQIFWECQSLSRGEDGKVVDQNTKRSLMASLTGTEWEWTRLVEDYTRRKLTKVEDRLFALAGLTNLREASSGSYIFGLWKFSLHAGLLWYNCATTPGRRIENLAPSWSWASIDGPVKWESWVRHAHPVAFMYGWTTPISMITRIKAVTRSKRLMSDKELECRVTSDLPYDRDLMNIAFAITSAETDDYGTEIGWAVFDELRHEEGRQGTYVAIQISDNPEAVGKSLSHNILIVEGSGDPPHSRHARVGVGEVVITGWFHGGEVTKLWFK